MPQEIECSCGVLDFIVKYITQSAVYMIGSHHQVKYLLLWMGTHRPVDDLAVPEDKQ